MPKAPLLSADEVSSRLGGLRGWTLEGDRISKRFTFKDFAQAVRFLDQITPLADEQNHHPDVSIHWNELTLSLWTHASGGLTERDFRLARAIDDMAED
ncbi:MAG TPA: 4a-hydroxytetrahydrobiopterin dehydratase [Actinomycetota bacterium]|nr:4a-hydroxytetrahydrobiopterin dehydratase [Actinomycetota bacterium]